ncbi:MAG: hypothetical protein ABIR24_09145 [Verrucomicrobiota bacterium]
MKKIVLKLGIALVSVSTIEAINLRLLFLHFYSGDWFLALYFPLFLGMTVFGITIYFLTKGILWKRLLITLCTGLGLTLIWFFVFMLAFMRITGVGGTLLDIQN